MNKNTCACVGELAKEWIEDFLNIEVSFTLMEDYSVTLQFWDLSETTFDRIYSGVEGMCLMYSKLKHLEGEKGWAKQPCVKASRNSCIPKACFIYIFTDETNEYGSAIGIRD